MSQQLAHSLCSVTVEVAYVHGGTLIPRDIAGILETTKVFVQAAGAAAQ
jgi:hypothetical protein